MLFRMKYKLYNVSNTDWLSSYKIMCITELDLIFLNTFDVAEQKSANKIGFLMLDDRKQTP